jgi:tRNA1Val (adenine37-N6)-methyltransferase
MASSVFHFKKFSVAQEGATQPVGTDAILLGAWADVRGVQRMLDIGTGAGVIALMLAQRLSEQAGADWQGTGVELHAPSAALAGRNFRESPWAGRLTVHTGDIQTYAAQYGGPGFDLMVSNPPYFSGGLRSPVTSRSMGRHNDPLPPADLLQAAAGLLTASGRFCAILPEKEALDLCERAVLRGLYWTRITRVRGKPGKPVERWLLQLERNPYPLETGTLVIEEPGGGYTGAYRALTEGFYR